MVSYEYMNKMNLCVNRSALFKNEASALLELFSSRGICTTGVLMRLSAGKYKTTKFKTKPLTYEMSFRPEHVGVMKSWLSWHTSNLEGFGIRQGRTVAEDEIIRRFVKGIWHDMFTDEVIIKRRGNIVIVAGLVYQKLSVRKMYWLLGFTEELLSYILKQPVKFEIQSILNKEDVIYKYI